MDRFTTASTPIMRPTLFPTGLTVLRALVVARWLALAWMVGIVAFSGDELRHTTVAWGAVIVTLGLTALSTALVKSDPARLIHIPFVLAEVGLAVGLSIVDGYVFEPGHVFETTQSIATQWPLIAAASAGLAFGPVVAGLLGLLIGPAEWLGALANDYGSFGTRHVVSLVATSIFYGLCGVVFGWFAQLLRRAETEIADQRARDEVGRVMHDTVLQTLALVERRVAATDPELAATARETDTELRAFLFGSAGRNLDSLEARIRHVVERARRGHATAVTVSVLDDGCRLEHTEQDLVARAIGEAVSNALEHADASRVVVFAETDEAGHVFASVRDDGIGFDVDRPRSSHGVDESIIGRIESIGGRVEIASSPESGTEVSLWTH